MSWQTRRSLTGSYVRFEAAVLTMLFAGSLCCAIQNPRFKDRHRLVEHGAAQSEPAKDIVDSGNARNIKLKVDVLTDRWQVARGGLRFLLEITNESDSTVEIYDPSEMVSIQLTNEAGYPIALPAVPPLCLINTADPEGTRASLDRDRPYVIEGVPDRGLPPDVKTVLDVVDHSYVSLSPGERFWVPVRITRVIANPKEAPKHRADFLRENPGSAPPRPAASAVGRGSYLLRVSLPLVQRGGRGSTVRSKKIPIGLE